MKNLILVLSSISILSQAYSARPTLKDSYIPDEKGGAKDGRGVGGGYGGHVNDAFFDTGRDLDDVIRDRKALIDGVVYSNLPGTPSDAESFAIDTQAILDFLRSGRIEVAREGDLYIAEGASYVFVDGTLHLNATVWDKKLIQGDYQAEVIGVLLAVTGQGDESGKVARFYADLLKVNKSSSATKEGSGQQPNFY